MRPPPPPPRWDADAGRARARNAIAAAADVQHEVLRGIPADLAAEYLAGRLGETNAVAARHVALATSLVGRGGEGADLSQCVAAFTMPDGTLELHHLSVRRRADAVHGIE